MLHRRVRVVLLALVTCFPLLPLEAARAQGEGETTDRTQSPYFFVQSDDPNVDRLPLKGTRVDVVARYDNSPANRANPNPGRTVTFGETSNDEMMFGTFEFVAAAGVSPARPDDRLRMEVLLSTLPHDSSFVLTAPFMLGQMSSGLYLPKSGDGTWYLAVRPGIVIDVPVTGIEWTGNAFRFDTEMRAGGIGSAMTVTGEVAADGTIRGNVKAAGRRGLVPFQTFSGARRQP